MAITTEVFVAPVGWARSDVLNIMEEAFVWGGYHGGEISGLCTGVAAFSGGGILPGGTNDFYLDIPTTSSGIGTGATLNVYREQSGTGVNTITVNKPGKDYVQGEILTIDPSYFGGGTGIAVTVNVGYSAGIGTTTAYFDKDTDPESTDPWAVLKQDNDSSKLFGTTYRGFRIEDNYRMYALVGPSYSPVDWRDFSTTGMNKKSFRGTQYLDCYDRGGDSIDESRSLVAQFNASTPIRFATTSSPNTHELKLTAYRSSIDTDFVVYVFSQPTVSGDISDKTYDAVYFHRFDSSLWDLDEVFLGGATLFRATDPMNTTQASSIALTTQTMLTGQKYQYGQSTICTRTAEAGYTQQYGSGHTGNYSVTTAYVTTQGDNTNTNTDNFQESTYTSTQSYIYSRVGGDKDTGYVNDVSGGQNYDNYVGITTYRSVVKGIPLSANIIPCPYYLPDDFVLLEINYPQSEVDFLQGDIIKISETEQYVIIKGSYNKWETTNGIFFCGRVV